MTLLANRENRRLFLALSSVLTGFALLFALLLRPASGQSILWGLPLLFALMAGILLLICALYLRRQHAQLEAAISAITAYLGGDGSARMSDSSNSVTISVAEGRNGRPPIFTLSIL